MDLKVGEYVDFTTWRKGRRTRGAAKIGLCPKCGKKGEIRPHMVTHRMQYLGWCWNVENADWCSVKTDKTR